MKRGIAGHYHVSSTAGEKVRAFVPAPLPPQPPVNLSGRVQQRLERALLACGRLDAISALLPDRDLFLYGYIRREAVLSSQIEGTQSSLSDLLMYEVQEAPGLPVEDVVEVSHYVAALEHGVRRLREGFPLSSRLIREVHAILLQGSRGGEKSPGEFRRSQNWLGGTRPGNAHFVPPPPHLVGDCMGALELFLHQEDDALPVLVRAALAHVQFETIHPFLDGNGRVGRLLIVLILFDAGILKEPLLYLSLYFKRHRAQYYQLLDEVRRDGNWESWLEFFLEGVDQTAGAAVATTHQLLALFREDHARLEAERRSSPATVRILQALRARPLATVGNLAEAAATSYPTAAKALGVLGELGIVEEATGRQRGKVYAYKRYLEILNEETEPL